MSLVGYWVTPIHYRIKQTMNGRTQNIIFEGKPKEEWEKVIRACTKRCETELLGPVDHKKRRYSISRTAHANDVFNDQILTGKIEPCPPVWSRYWGEKPGVERELWQMGL